MMLNPDATKQTQEAVFSQKIVNPFHYTPSPLVIFNQVYLEIFRLTPTSEGV